MAFPHNDLQFRFRPGVFMGEERKYWTKKGFPKPVQLPKLFYVRKQADIGIRLSRLAHEVATPQVINDVID